MRIAGLSWLKISTLGILSEGCETNYGASRVDRRSRSKSIKKHRNGS